MKRRMRIFAASVVSFLTFAYSVHIFIMIMWLQFGNYPPRTLAIGFWLNYHLTCSIVVAVAIAFRSWLVAQAFIPSLIFGGIIVIGSASQRFWPSLDFSFSASITSLALYATIFMRLTLFDLSNFGIGPPEQKHPPS